MENIENELTALKEQYASLKQEIQKQELITDAMLRSVMKDRAGRIKGTVRTSMFCAILTILFSPYVFHYNPVMGCSWAFVIGTDIMMLIAIFFDWHTTKELYFKDYASCDILSFLSDIRRVRKRYIDWMKFGFLLLAIWFTWLVWEVLSHSNSLELTKVIIPFILLGVVIGVVVGIKMDLRIIRNCNEIIKQINNL
ncbi:MAG: hypothetical protein KBS95_05260 [Alistipes sp.]|nr:hypothetical protein [Candidatus Alistipes equi]